MIGVPFGRTSAEIIVSLGDEIRGATDTGGKKAVFFVTFHECSIPACVTTSRQFFAPSMTEAGDPKFKVDINLLPEGE